MFSSHRREGDWRRRSVQSLSLKRKPSFVGMMTVLLSKEMPSLVHAANSEHLLAEATATRKMVLRKRSSKEAVLFLNLGVWSVSRA